MQIKSILFDLDGTLLDSVPIILQAAQQVFGTMGLPYDEDALRKMIGIPLKVQAEEVAGDRAEEFLVRYRHVYGEYQNKFARLFPYTIEMLNTIRAKGHIVGLVTSKVAKPVHNALNSTGLADMFSVIITADDVTHPKPDPEPIMKALNILNLSPDQALYVGDSMFDMDMAQRANVAAVAMSWGARSKEDLLLICPDRVFDNWHEFLAWLD